MDGRHYHCNYFFVFFHERSFPGSSYDKEKEDHNPLHCFRMGIIEEISFFFFDVEDPARSQRTICKNDAKTEKKRCVDCKQKRLKST